MRINKGIREDHKLFKCTFWKLLSTTRETTCQGWKVNLTLEADKGTRKTIRFFHFLVHSVSQMPSNSTPEEASWSHCSLRHWRRKSGQTLVLLAGSQVWLNTIEELVIRDQDEQRQEQAVMLLDTARHVLCP